MYVLNYTLAVSLYSPDIVPACVSERERQISKECQFYYAGHVLTGRGGEPLYVHVSKRESVS